QRESHPLEIAEPRGLPSAGIGSHRRADGQNGTLIVEDRLYDSRQGGADAVIARPLSLYYPVGRAAYEILDSDPLRRLEARASFRQREFREGHASDGDLRPVEDLGVAVLPQDIGVHVLRIDAEPPAEKGAKARGVQGG